MMKKVKSILNKTIIYLMFVIFCGHVYSIFEFWTTEGLYVYAMLKAFVILLICIKLAIYTVEVERAE